MAIVHRGNVQYMIEYRTDVDRGTVHMANPEGRLSNSWSGLATTSLHVDEKGVRPEKVSTRPSIKPFPIHY